MSEKKFEECDLLYATHVEINGVRHELLDNVQYSFNGINHGIRLREEDAFIPEEVFSILGIKPLKKKKIEFEGIVKQSRLSFLFLDNVPEGVPLGTKFKCVQILEEE
jgi:hypothetical protein